MEIIVKFMLVYYEEYGSGIPVLMLHGRPSDHRHMVADMEPLFQNRSGFRRLYPDMPGTGKTPGADQLTNLDQLLEVASEFMRLVAPNERFVVIGTSYGGYLAQGLIYQQGSLIDGALLLTPLIEPNPAKQHYPPHQVLVEDAGFRAALTPQENYLPDMFVVQNLENLAAFRTDILPALQVADHAFLAKLGEEAEFSFPVEKLTTPFPAPVLILTGRQDAICGYQDAWAILENYPRATFAVLDRAGHFLSYEQKIVFQALAGEWLNRVAEYIQHTAEIKEKH
jgi:pimeloyl-ACP methyl ester carboxylesterase